eukprot:scaffold80625_cov17-Tisochrysis_lutea.AAC.1
MVQTWNANNIHLKSEFASAHLCLAMPWCRPPPKEALEKGSVFRNAQCSGCCGADFVRED